MRVFDSIKMASQPLVFTLGLASFAGCAGVDPDLVDGEHDSFVAGGKEDGNGIEDGSPEARGVLRVANETSLDVLDDSTRQGGVGLDRRAAQNIVAYRLGDDGIAGTSDDERFDTLAELDAVPYVGPVVFAKLLAYADANGYSEEEEEPVVTNDPFDPNSCTGASMTKEEALAFFEPGAREVVIGEYMMQRRSRPCNDVTGCGAWGEPITIGRGNILLAVHGDDIVLELEDSRRSWDSRRRSVRIDCSTVSEAQMCSGYRYANNPDAWNPISFVNKIDGSQLELSGSLTSSCIRLADKATMPSGEYEYVLLTRFNE